MSMSIDTCEEEKEHVIDPKLFQLSPNNLENTLKNSICELSDMSLIVEEKSIYKNLEDLMMHENIVCNDINITNIKSQDDMSLASPFLGIQQIIPTSNPPKLKSILKNSTKAVSETSLSNLLVIKRKKLETSSMTLTPLHDVKRLSSNQKSLPSFVSKKSEFSATSQHNKSTLDTKGRKLIFSEVEFPPNQTLNEKEMMSNQSNIILPTVVVTLDTTKNGILSNLDLLNEKDDEIQKSDMLLEDIEASLLVPNDEPLLELCEDDIDSFEKNERKINESEIQTDLVDPTTRFLHPNDIMDFVLKYHLDTQSLSSEMNTRILGSALFKQMLSELEITFNVTFDPGHEKNSILIKYENLYERYVSNLRNLIKTSEQNFPNHVKQIWKFRNKGSSYSEALRTEIGKYHGNLLEHSQHLIDVDLKLGNEYLLTRVTQRIRQSTLEFCLSSKIEFVKQMFREIMAKRKKISSDFRSLKQRHMQERRKKFNEATAQKISREKEFQRNLTSYVKQITDKKIGLEKDLINKQTDALNIKKEISELHNNCKTILARIDASQSKRNNNVTEYLAKVEEACNAVRTDVEPSSKKSKSNITNETLLGIYEKILPCRIKKLPSRHDPTLSLYFLEHSYLLNISYALLPSSSSSTADQDGPALSLKCREYLDNSVPIHSLTWQSLEPQSNMSGVERFVDRYSTKTFKLIKNAYGSISSNQTVKIVQDVTYLALSLKYLKNDLIWCATQRCGLKFTDKNENDSNEETSPDDDALCFHVLGKLMPNSHYQITCLLDPGKYGKQKVRFTVKKLYSMEDRSSYITSHVESIEPSDKNYFKRCFDLFTPYF